jgi:hypothetical protein
VALLVAVWRRGRRVARPAAAPSEPEAVRGAP